MEQPYFLTLSEIGKGNKEEGSVFLKFIIKSMANVEVA